MGLRNIIILTSMYFVSIRCQQSAFSCRDRSNHMRQDGGLCFEIPPWQHQPVELEQHVSKLRGLWRAELDDSRRSAPANVALANSKISLYMDTVLAPFLDTYHRNIQNAYQQLTSKILKRIKEEINAAVKKKQLIYSELINLADELDVPSMCDEERRQARTIASKHVALIYACTEDARASIARMGRYAEEMIAITRNHMKVTVSDVARTLDDSVKGNIKADIAVSLKELSSAAVHLGYELDISLTNARRHNEQSCERLSSCCSKAKRQIEEAVVELKDQLYHCVYA